MNSTNSSDIISMLNVKSIALNKDILSAFIVWAIVGIISFLTATLTLATVFVWKPLHTDTQVLAANLAMSELVGALSLAVAAFYHFIHIAFELPETTTKQSCYVKFAVHYFSIDVSGFFHFIISLDRFTGAIFPLHYNRRPKRYSTYLSIVAWTVPLVTFIIGVVDSSGEVYIPVCLIRGAVGDTFYAVYIYSLLTISIVAVLGYCITIIVLKYQIRASATNVGNIAEIKKRLRSQVMKALAISAVTHLLTFTGAAFGGVLLANFAFLGTVQKPYLGVLFFSGGISCFVIYLICQQEFRAGFRYFCLKIKTGIEKITSNHSQVLSDPNRVVELRQGN